MHLVFSNPDTNGRRIKCPAPVRHGRFADHARAERRCQQSHPAGRSGNVVLMDTSIESTGNK